MRLLHELRRMLPIREAHAHCDIPCGIYDPVSAKIAAQTVLKMVMRIEALEWTEDTSHSAFSNTLSRYIAVKEQHAELVKHEIGILSNDYFKHEHFEEYPNLPMTVWETAKLASANKQNVDLDSAKKLVESVDEIARVFWATKGVEYDDAVADVRFGT